MELQLESIEDHIREIIEEINVENGFGKDITVDTCPNDIGISSQVLVSVMGIIENTLDIKIPSNCYIFHEKPGNRKLTIKEASLKLFNTIKT